ncbi:MAG: methyltransferase domain-containing protein [Candidatus Hodarchaeota archaeon]
MTNLLEKKDRKLPTLNIDSTRENCLSPELGRKLREYFDKEQRWANFSNLQSLKNTHLTSIFTEVDIEVLSRTGLIDIGDEESFSWNFMPVLGNQILLFGDLPRYESYRQYVWLSARINGRSWRFAEFWPIKHGDHVLDLGTGAGLLALQARLKGASAVGIDINPRAVPIASLNRCLNGLDQVEFRVVDWNAIDGSQFDLIVSQPPFGTNLEGTSPSLAFDGKSLTGIHVTKEIIKRFCPQKGQTLSLYVHILENERHSRFQGLLNELVDDKAVSIEIDPQDSYSVEAWWERTRRLRNVESIPLPSSFQGYCDVVAYFVSLSR